MRNRLFKSESFYQALANASIYSAAMGVLFAVVFGLLDHTFKATLMREVDDDLGAIAVVYRGEIEDNPDKEVREIIESRLHDPDADDAFLVMRGQSVIAGNLPSMAPREGVFTMPMPQTAHDHDKAHILYGRGIFVAPGIYAYVGRDLVFVKAAEHTLLYAFAAVLAISLVLALAGAVFLSRKFLDRIDEITETCRGIIAGRLSERIPGSAPGREFRRLGSVINTMLDRIQVLMESLRQVSTDVAHDLRTPLTHLRHKLERVRESAATREEYETAVEGAIADCDKLLGIFTALLRIAQIEAGQRRAAFAPVDLAALSSQASEIYAPVMEDAQHPFVSVIATVPVLKGDHQLLLQAVFNLLDNAIAHSPAGTRVLLSCGMEEGYVVLSVADNGPGVPEEERAKVLRRFYRAEQSRSTPGSGLGLSLVAAIADLHEAELILGDAKPGLVVTLRFAVAGAG